MILIVKLLRISALEKCKIPLGGNYKLKKKIFIIESLLSGPFLVKIAKESWKTDKKI